MKKGQMFLVSSLIILLFLSLLGFQRQQGSRVEKLYSNIFHEYQNAAGYSFAYGIDEATESTARFTRFLRERNEGSLSAVYVLAVQNGTSLSISVSNFLGKDMEKVTIYQSLTSEYDSLGSIADGQSRKASFVGPSSDYSVTLEYFENGEKKTLSYSAPSGPSFYGIVSVGKSSLLAKAVKQVS